MSTFVAREHVASPGRAREVVDAQRLAVLVTADLDVAHIPLICVDPPGEEPTTMVGHAAAAGPFAMLTESVRAVVIHRGVEGYITPSWYPAKQEHGRVVPTWDYEAVHLSGTLHVSRERDDILAAVRLLTDLEEGVRDEPWSVDDAPAAFIDRMARNIVALWFKVDAVVAIDKLSQNRSAADVAGVITGLRGEGRDDLATAVERTPPGR